MWHDSYVFGSFWGCFSLNPNLHTILPPSYPADLHHDLAYQLTINPPLTLLTHLTFLPSIVS